jgi:hypothetical protein
MSLSTELTNIHDNFVSETSHVLEFIRKSRSTLNRREARSKPTDFGKKEWDEMDKLISFLEKSSKGKQNKDESIILYSEKLGKWLFSKVEPIKHRTMLSEMSLSYLISFEEAFLKEYLRAILSSRRVLLRSNKQISYEAICEHNSMTSLIRGLAQKEVNDLGFGSIDDFAKYFLDKFNIDFDTFPHWKELREATYRRHLIVHNRGFTNERYCRATGFKGKNKHMSTDISYCRTVGEVLLEFIDFVHEQILVKLKLSQPSTKKAKRQTSTSKIRRSRRD